MKKLNLRGMNFGRLNVLRDSGKRGSCGAVIWRCFCLCGELTEVHGSNLVVGHTRSCGCLRREEARRRVYKHGDTGSKLYLIWKGMKERCYSPNSKSWKYYGERGIAVCPKWIESFIAFKDWALENGYEDNLTIDRIDSNGDYQPDNCQWLTRSENSRKAGMIKKK